MLIPLQMSVGVCFVFAPNLRNLPVQGVNLFSHSQDGRFVLLLAPLLACMVLADARLQRRNRGL